MTDKPNITVSSRDMERLEALLDSASTNAFPGAKALRLELDRADVVEPEKMPPSVVTMNSTVRFEMEPSGQTFEMTLCYPKEADGAMNKISVLAPVGSALLGLSVGQQIEWPIPGGKTNRVRIVDVTYQPERVGDYSR